MKIKTTRRQFLRFSATAMAGFFISSPLAAMATTHRQRSLTFFHTHTEEYLKIRHAPGVRSIANQRKINKFLRDFRTETVHPIDPGLLDIICAVQNRASSNGVIEVISAYRSPQTNRALRKKSRGVAKKSLHMEGRAIDIRIRDLSTRHLRDVAAYLGAGGVGYYSKSDFVHLDTGDRRTW
ncbi:Uncharacterized conserved protein YcbK, DUF882 family [Desulfocicer vacuolatum DSM 3385]|uniref:Murein endopeptidase K n=1 Tax=Desulfocicer vacuolatum DSM 3385 TaxID=1121400 RepID=A0A1W2B7P3_9BACT|nr:YcbK family protein [Desulfocicer vacuolatum]SMC69043.1 Uncharacterized conserved protein YcbK, DUF882 family [Desulfocicer vacuolatum DSM 3385]